MTFINPIDFILHVDKYVGSMISNYGNLTYLIIFLVIFFETGLVITPFLPGDSLLFVVGAFSSQGYLDAVSVFLILCLAAIIGDTVNYWIGNYFGEKVFSKSRFFKKEYLERTKKFYKKQGAKTIVLARFIPIIRTFAPFVAGVGKMRYFKFLTYNVIGGVVWVGFFLSAGYFFGGIPFVEKNLTLVIYTIVVISFLPIVVEYFRKRKKEKSENFLNMINTLDEPIKNIIKEVGFQYQTMAHINRANKMEVEINKFLDNIGKEISSKFGGSIQYIIGELTDNIEQHSKYSNANIFFNQNVKENKVEIAIFNDGVSIPVVFKNNKIKFSRDSEAIKMALGGTTTKRYDISRGFGLRTTRKIVKALKGKMLIISGKGIINVNGSKDIINNLNEGKLQGTFIYVKLKTPDKDLNIYPYLE